MIDSYYFSISEAFKVGIIDKIISQLVTCSKQMKADCLSSSNFMRDNEDVITNRLVANYLNAKPDYFRYEPQSLENYDKENDKYIGRTDIKVISGDYFRNAKAYHIVESKRLDGSITLNKKYITEGVDRFLISNTESKYSSYYQQNIMFGYVVKAIDIQKNANKIDELQCALLKDIRISPFILKNKEDPQYYVYACEYTDISLACIKLHHLFYDFSDAFYDH